MNGEPSNESKDSKSKIESLGRPTADGVSSVNLDPFSNIEELRVSQVHIEAVGLKKQLLTVPVRKPSKEWFVRVHPDPAF